MNDHGSITVFLVIILSLFITVLMIFYPIVSHKYFINDINRSIYIENQRLLASYNDSLYQSFGLLAYEKKTVNKINQQIITNMETFKSPLNLYEIVNVETNYQTNGFENKELISRQIQYFMRHKISQSLLKELTNHISESEVVLRKTEILKEKLTKSKGYKKIKSFHRELLTKKSKFDDFQKGLKEYEAFIEKQKQLIDDLNRLKNDTDSEQFKQGLIQLKNSYEVSQRHLKKKRALIKEIIELKKRLKAHGSKSLDESNMTVDEYKQLESDITKKISEKKHLLMELIQEEKTDDNILLGLKELLKKLSWEFPVLNQHTFEKLDLSDASEVLLTDDESLLLNEYILGAFTSVTESEYRDYAFYNQSQSFKRLNGEIEFIIEGKAINQSTYIIGGKILAIREAMNLSHIILDTDKRNFLLTTAKTPVYGLFVAAGLGLTWSTLESTIDIKKIYSGKGTPFMKISEENFVIDLETLQNPKSLNILDHNQPMFMHYNDYLRLFLLPISDHLKIKRLCQVIHYYLPLNDLVLNHEITYNITYRNKLTGQDYQKIFRLVGNYNE